MEFTCHFGQKQYLYIYEGDLLSLRKIDMLAVNVTVNGKGGTLADDIYHNFGKDYQNLKDKAFKSAYEGSVKVCIGGTSEFKHVAHVVLVRKRKNDKQTHRANVRGVFDKLIKEMYSYKSTSLALPSLGSGMIFALLEIRLL